MEIVALAFALDGKPSSSKHRNRYAVRVRELMKRRSVRHRDLSRGGVGLAIAPLYEVPAWCSVFMRPA